MIWYRVYTDEGQEIQLRKYEKLASPFEFVARRYLWNFGGSYLYADRRPWPVTTKDFVLLREEAELEEHERDRSFSQLLRSEETFVASPVGDELQLSTAILLHHKEGAKQLLGKEKSFEEWRDSIYDTPQYFGLEERKDDSSEVIHSSEIIDGKVGNPCLPSQQIGSTMFNDCCPQDRSWNALNGFTGPNVQLRNLRTPQLEAIDE